MKRDKELSFSDFFQEGIFTQSKDASYGEEALLTPPKEDNFPILELKASADDAEMREYRKALRHFFITGEQTARCLHVKTAPVLAASYLRGEIPDTGFPVFFSYEDQSVTPLRDLLKGVLENTFPPGEAKILAQNLPRVELHVRSAMETPDPAQDYSSLLRGAISALTQLDVHGDEGKVFREQCAKFQTELLRKDGALLAFSAYTAFQLLNLQIRARRVRNQAFLETLKKQKAGLEELLLLQKGNEHDEGKGASLQSSFDFAGSMISFDKIEDIMPPGASSGLPEARLQRVRAGIQTLDEALNYFAGTPARAFVNQEIASRYSLEETLSEASLVLCEQRPSAAAKEVYDNEISFLVQVTAASRMAELEIRNQYDEDLHTPYFNSFGMGYLGEEDLQRFPGLLVVEDSRQLMHEPEDLLVLLSGNVPVKVLAVNRLSSLDYPDDAAPALHQEPAALAISHRNAFIFQGAADTPVWLNNALREGLLAPSPALWNVLLSEPGSADTTGDFVRINIAAESRHFPRLSYNIRAGAAFGSRFDISANPQPELHFPSYALDIETHSGIETAKYELTVADFFALDSRRAARLEIVPVTFRNEDLISLAAYLYQSPDKLAGKIPFIWVVDEQNHLHQAALPYSWLARCEERLDYWQFIQELGGVNSYHVKKAIEKAKAEWEAQKAEEIAALRAETAAEIERVRREEAGQAMERLVNVLLDLDNPVYAPSAQPAVNPAPASIAGGEKPAEKTTPEPATEEEPAISSEVWVESFRCTSCNDCISQLPGVFKYNSDKQAYVHNPKGGTYAKIVTVAEKCPAKCIHPGLPQNPGEPGVEELIKRAEALN